jgi:hypothetical protein
MSPQQSTVVGGAGGGGGRVRQDSAYSTVRTTARNSFVTGRAGHRKPSHGVPSHGVP